MNLTTPPPVEDLDPQYADEMRAELVRNARGNRRQRSVWVPALAAACGVAVIACGVVAATRSGGGPAPVGTTPSSTPDASKPINDVRKVPANASPRVSLDLGPAGRDEAIASARDCLADAQSAAKDAGPSQPTLGATSTEPIGIPSPAEAATATVHDARWVRTLPGYIRKITPGQRALVQTFTTAKGIYVMCVDNHYQVLEKHRRPNGSADITNPVNGQWTVKQATAGSTILYTDLSFDAVPQVARVELRIRWSGGASPWYGVTVKGGAGFVEASQNVHAGEKVETDVRAFDASGKQIYTATEHN